MEELDLRWRKSSRSDNGGQCVEVADRDGLVLVRDSKARTAAMLAVCADDWRQFTERLKTSQNQR